ncbi:phosphopyruvate hydratase [Desulfoferula mesophila]
MPTIKKINAREIINGRGVPAVEVELTTDRGLSVCASAPSGVSVSSHEAVELRDGGERYLGKGVLRAVENVEQVISPALAGLDVTDQALVDQRLLEVDGTPDKSHLGGNAITAVSLAAARAGAQSLGLELYRYLGGVGAKGIPVMCPNMLSGSKTAGNELDFEDYLLVPYGFESIEEALRAGVEVFHRLHRNLESRFGLIAQITALAPPMQTSEEAFDMILEAVEQAGYARRMGLGIDVAAGNFYDVDKGLYALRAGDTDADGMISLYRELTDKYPIVFIEDGLMEEDFAGFARLTEAVDCLVVGDDLFATNTERLALGAAQGAGNAMLCKVNQAGTVSEAMAAASAAQRLGYDVVASVRSGETDDPAQADLAVAVGASLMKIGCPLRGEMITKYNRLMNISRRLGRSAVFHGAEFGF